MPLRPDDLLAHRALEGLLRAETAVRRRLSADLQRQGLSASGFSMLVVLTTAGGELPLSALRGRLRASKANATEVVSTLHNAGLVVRARGPKDRRTATVALTDSGRRAVESMFPDHTGRVRDAFAVLDEHEKRSLARICRKLAA